MSFLSQSSSEHDQYRLERKHQDDEQHGVAQSPDSLTFFQCFDHLCYSFQAEFDSYFPYDSETEKPPIPSQWLFAFLISSPAANVASVTLIRKPFCSGLSGV